jgi:DNA polymerase-3 subunit chi
MTGPVDFYVLDSATVRQRWQFACRLIEKAYLNGERVVVLAGTAEDAAGLDEMLWTFEERSFVPHEVCDGSAADTQAPVQLAVDAATSPPADLLVNLSGRLPTDLTRFGKVAEIVDADVDWRRLGRERFKAYRDLKLELHTHQPGGNGTV